MSDGICPIREAGDCSPVPAGHLERALIATVRELGDDCDDLLTALMRLYLNPLTGRPADDAEAHAAAQHAFETIGRHVPMRLQEPMGDAIARWRKEHGI